MLYKIFRLNNRKVVLLGAWSLIISLNILQTAIYKVSNPNYDWMWVLKFPIITLLVGLFLIFFWVLPGYHFIKKRALLLKVVLFIFHAIVFQMAYILLIFLIFGYWSGHLSWKWYTDTVYNFFVTDFHNVFKSYLYVISIIFAFDYFKSKEQIIVSKNKVEQELLLSKHQSLKAKLQPHFLFNTLNSIVALIEENKRKAQKSLINLSDLLRYSMDIKPDELIPIEEEIDLLKKYISVEKYRYEEQINIEWSIEVNEVGLKVPPMLLQPLLENSIKHGFKKLNRTLNIVIEVNKTNRFISIKNDGHPLPKEFSEGIGLQVVKQLLEYHFSDSANFKLYQEEHWIVSKISF